MYGCQVKKAASNWCIISIQGDYTVALLWKASNFAHYQVSNHLTSNVNGNPAAVLQMR